MLCRPYILIGCLVSLLMQRALAQGGTLSCQLVACIPDSGDILIGRGDSVSINSTCGMVKAESYIATCTEGPPRPCSFVCNANDSSTSHPPENIALPYSSANVNKTWWQSSIGDEVVSIEISLRALFHFTHFVMTFRSPRPLSLIVEKSRDFGKTYSVYQYFADDCLSTFGMEARICLIDINDVICSESYLEERSNEIVYRVLPPHLHITELYTPQVTEKITITNLRITMARHDLSSIPLNAEVAQYQYFAVYSLVLRGWCFCYGHASECDPIEGVPQQPGMVNPICRCIHNTRGSNCEECLPLYNDRPWKAAAPNGEANACKRCQCYGHADSCHYDEEINGGVCDNCTHNTAGINCEQCQPFFYRNTTTLRNDPDVCLECACDPSGSKMKGECIRDDDNSRSLRSGQCLCKTNVEASDPYTTLCDTCLPGYFNLSADNPNGCDACNCNSAGSLGEECDQKSGQCQCKLGVTGLKCDKCKVERCCLNSSDPEGCRPCNCDVGGSYNSMCDVDTGQCQCRANIEGLKCDILPNGTFVNVVVTYEIEDIVTNNKTKIINVGNKTGPFVVEVPPNITIKVTVDPEITTGNKVTIIFGIPNNTDVTDVNFNITINATNPVDPGEFPGGPCRDGATSTTSSTTSFTVNGKDAVFNPRTGLYTLEIGYVCLEKNTNYTITIDYVPKDKNTTIYLDKINIIPDVRIFNFTPPTTGVNCSVPRPPVVCEVYTTNVTVNNTITVSCDDPVVVEDLIKDPSCSIITKVIIILKNETDLCNCDDHGSLNDICETIGGQCNCRPGFGGRRCDKCLPHI